MTAAGTALPYGADSDVLAPGIRGVEANVLRELLKVSVRPGMISLAGGAPAADLFDVEGLREAAELTLREAPAQALQYGGSEGTVALREELCELMAARGVGDIEPHDLVVTTGSSQGIDIIGRTLLDPGEVIAVERPTFLATLIMAALCRASVAEVAGDADGLVPADLERVLATEPVRVLYITPTFSNPSGAVLTRERRLRILELAVEHRVIVIEDDPYGLLWFDEPPPPTMLELSRDVPGAEQLCVYLGSLSKIVAPGMRLGWLIGSPPIVAKAAVVKQVADAHTSSLDQEIATRYLRSGRLDAGVQRARGAYAERAGFLADALGRHVGTSSLQFAKPRGGMFLWCELAGARADELARIALDEQVAVVPGGPFYATKPDRERLRLSYSQLGAETSNEAARRVARALDRTRGVA